VEVPAETLTELGGEAEAGANVTVFRGRGCKKCSNSGYKGRKGLYEVMPLGGEIADLIGKGSVAAEEIRREAMRLGMLTLRQVGLKKVLEGITTIQEVLRVTRKKQS
jgi:type IV pilus assembly protein PilB